MPTRAGVSNEPAEGPTRTRQPLPNGGVRVWGEVSVTLAVSEDPPQFIKVTFGHERISASDTEEAIRRTERMIHKTNSEVVERRAEQYKRLIERV